MLVLRWQGGSMSYRVVNMAMQPGPTGGSIIPNDVLGMIVGGNAGQGQRSRELESGIQKILR